MAGPLHSCAPALVLLVLLGASAPSSASTLAVARGLDAAGGLKERPVMKVVRMLQDMKDELSKSLEDDKAVHEQLECWCKTNEKEKTAAIDMGEQTQNQLEAFLGEAAAKMTELKTKRDATWEEVNRDEEALQEASALRMKENKEFHADAMNLMEAVKACEQALVVLGEHNTGFAQVQSVAQALKRAQVLKLARATPASAALRNFILQAQGATSFLAVPGYQSAAPQSGQIFGVLGQMKADFQDDLADAQAREKKAAEEFKALKSAKKEEISMGRKLQSKLDQEIATLQQKHAQAFKELDDTKAQLELDREFLANLNKKCSESSDEFDQRVKDRLTEIAAVEDTIEILNDDKAYDNFDETVNAASFLQTASASAAAATQKERLRRVASGLAEAAARTRSPALALLANRAQLDAFAKVKEEIDKVVEELNKQQADEVEHRDWCIDEMNRNNRSTEEAYDRRDGLQAKIADLEKTVEYLAKEMEAATTAIAEMQTQMKRASETREAESADYQQTVSDQRLTQIILRKAHDRMAKVYAFLEQQRAPGAPHVRTSGTHTDPGNGPARFTKYEKHSGGGRALRMIEEVIADAKKTEADAIKSEQDSQTAYESFMKDSNKAITAYTKKTVSMKASKAQAEEDLVSAKTDLGATVNKLKELHDTLGSVHSSCDYVLNNFEARQKARADEMDALGEAKAILSGAK